MNSIAISFLLINAAALLLLPRRLAALPLLAGACYMTRGQGIEVGPFHFMVLRMLIAVGLVRIMSRGERMTGGMNGLDWLMLAWALWASTSSVFHRDPWGALVYRLGVVYDAYGIYFLIRVFCQSLDDVIGLSRLTAILLVPVAAEMVYEKLMSHNYFAVFGGVSADPYIREGRVRANGPFAHAILAGTVGAVSGPLMVGLWRDHRFWAIAGIVASLTIVIASTSSGPIMSSAAAVGALVMWRFRRRVHLARWLGLAAYVALDLYMKDPAYYIIARIDLVGGSTGWHRARLIQSSIEHISEWWFAGTDYTRHWMASGVSWSAEHTDITNHYLQMGVIGGLPLMLLFIGTLAKGFSFVGQAVRHTDDFSPHSRFVVWTLGAALFTHAVTFISVSYFDQSSLFIYLNLALIGSVKSGIRS
ncbi:MAG: O-antigen ligase family protein [Nitrospirota bacterium]